MRAAFFAARMIQSPMNASPTGQFASASKAA
jgi:hypothetical protein